MLRAPQRLQPFEPEREGVVFVGGSDPVAILDQRPLAPGIVVDVGHKRRGRRHATQIHLHPFEQIGLIEHRTRDAAIRGGGCDRPIERIIL